MNALASPLKAAPCELSVVIPTYNEAANVRPLTQALEQAMAGIDYEILFVDDASPDGTADVVDSISMEYPSMDARRVRCIRRRGPRGLTPSVLDGLSAARGTFIAVMDADLQHDERLLPQLLAAVKHGDADVAVGSRYVAGGGVGTWSLGRRILSTGATLMSRAVAGTALRDPMSGFFVTPRHKFLDAMPAISGTGYKVLLDYLTSSPQKLRCAEVPYSFRLRRNGESKLDAAEMLNFARLLLDKGLRRHAVGRFLLFGAVGATGLLIHMTALALLLKTAPFFLAHAASGLFSMCSNYALNDRITFSDRSGASTKLTRPLAFIMVCLAGLVVSTAVGNALYFAHLAWWQAGVGGVIAGAAWNFAGSSAFVWRRPAPGPARYINR